MLYAFPFLAWLAPITSAVLLIVFWKTEDGRRLGLVIATVIFAFAAYWQFLATSASVSRWGLLFQTALAILLVVRWRWIQAAIRRGPGR